MLRRAWEEQLVNVRRGGGAHATRELSVKADLAVLSGLSRRAGGCLCVVF